MSTHRSATHCTFPPEELQADSTSHYKQASMSILMHVAVFPGASVGWMIGNVGLMLFVKFERFLPPKDNPFTPYQ